MKRHGIFYSIHYCSKHWGESGRGPEWRTVGRLSTAGFHGFAEEGGCCYRQVPMAQIQIARWLFDAKCGRCIRGSRSRQESGMSVVESASRAANPSLLGHWSTAPRSKFHFLPTFSDHSVFQFGRQLNQLSYVNSNN